MSVPFGKAAKIVAPEDIRTPLLDQLYHFVTNFEVSNTDVEGAKNDAC